ncbi:MAG: efflux RND transporter periplasmic adaptor subunit [Proteobacteria bacterium]|nr:efflux RND transporter periplasmic adaptor subunit [Pseudomonadota bacterium]
MEAQLREKTQADVLVLNPPRLNPRRKWLLAAAGIVVVVAIGAAVWMERASSSKALVPLADRTSIPMVSVIVPGVQPVSTQIMVTGTIAARHDLPIGDAGAAGRIDKVYVQAGDRVRKGQILAQIDDSVLVPQVNELVASLARARAQAALSAAEYRRAVAIGPQGGLSVQNIEQTQATAAMDAANVKMVAAQLAQKRADLALTRVVTPVPGIVLTRNAEVGQVASPGGPALFTIEDGGRVELVGQVAEQDLSALKVGQSASVHLVGYPRPFPGHIWLLGATIDTQNRLGQVRITLDPNPALRPGAFAHATIMVSRAERPVVPQTAIQSDGSRTYVYIVARHDRVERRDVQVGNAIPSGVVIDRGLTGRERVVSLAGGFLQSGERVDVAGAKSAQS